MFVSPAMFTTDGGEIFSCRPSIWVGIMAEQVGDRLELVNLWAAVERVVKLRGEA